MGVVIPALLSGHVPQSGHALLVVAEAGTGVTPQNAVTVDQDPQLGGIEAQFVIDQRAHALEALNPKVALSPRRQGSIVHHLMKGVHRREVMHLLAMRGWLHSKMDLITVMAPEQRAEAPLVQQGMTAQRLMVAAAVLVPEMMTEAPLMTKKTTSVIYQEAVSPLEMSLLRR